MHIQPDSFENFVPHIGTPQQHIRVVGGCTIHPDDKTHLLVEVTPEKYLPQGSLQKRLEQAHEHWENVTDPR